VNYGSLMREKLPGYIYQLLGYIGKTGDMTGCPVFVVGGFVRDLLIGRPNLDVDVVVEGDGIVFAHAFAEARDGEVKHHTRVGTAVVTLPDGFKVDVATARREVYDHPGALPSVEPSSIRDDLRRRDFTINAMAIVLNEPRFGELVDFFGGRFDLESKWVRVLHDLSFADDPTRIFRAIRFEQRHGFSLEPRTERLLEEAVAGDSLRTITGQRLRNEILLILKEEEPVPTIRRMAHFHLTKYIHPKIRVSDDLVELFHRTKGTLEWWNATSAHNEAEPALLNLIALTDQLNAAEAEDAAKRLVLRKKYSEALKASKVFLPGIIRRLCQVKDTPSQVYKALKGLPLEVLLFAMAKTHEIRDSIEYYLTETRNIDPLVNGNDLRKMGYPEGPLYTQILDSAFAAQLDGLIADKDEAIEFVKSRWAVDN
jgi:tRNA nucleotidyltransferase (CCA-adding enzyme)